MVEPRKTNSRRPPPGILVRCSSKSPHTASISSSGYSCCSDSPADSRTPASTSNGHEAAQRSVVAQRRQQHAGLLRGAAAEFDEGVRAAVRGDGGRLRTQDLRLGAGRVVLGQPGDLVEQVAAHGIVEPLGRQRLRRLPQPGEHVVAQRRAPRSRRPGWLDSVKLTAILSAGSASRRSSITSTRWRSGTSLPVRVVVVGLAGQHHAVRAAQHRQGVAPGGGQQSRTVGRQDVQPGIRVGGADFG